MFLPAQTKHKKRIRTIHKLFPSLFGSLSPFALVVRAHCWCFLWLPVDETVKEPIPKNSRWRPPKSTIRIKQADDTGEAQHSDSAATASDMSPDESLKVPLWAGGGSKAGRCVLCQIPNAQVATCTNAKRTNANSTNAQMPTPQMHKC